MKRIPVLLLCAAICAALPAISQTEGGSWELSLAGNGGSMSSSSEYTSEGHTHSSESEALSYFGLDFRAGYYVVNGLSLEPEVYFLALEKNPPTFNLGANVAYTFVVPESPVRPFLIAGYGIGNGVPLMQRLISRASDKLDIPVLRVGGGLKILLSKNIALKVEYRYERYTREESGTYYVYSYTSKSTENFHNVLFGFSVFLPGG
jgi:hypothetical protein